MYWWSLARRDVIALKVALLNLNGKKSLKCPRKSPSRGSVSCVCNRSQAGFIGSAWVIKNSSWFLSVIYSNFKLLSTINTDDRKIAATDERNNKSVYFRNDKKRLSSQCPYTGNVRGLTRGLVWVRSGMGLKCLSSVDLIWLWV